jgi:hypothetical protein
LPPVGPGDGVRGIGEEPLFVPIGQSGRAGDAGQRAEHRRMEGIGQVDVARVLRSRTDQRHIATHDVPQLRQLVELGAPKESPEAGDPAVSCGGDARACLGRADVHRSQLE